MTVSRVNRLHLLLDRQIRDNPQNLALIDHDGTKLPYRVLGAKVDKAERRLEELGVVAGDRVMIVAENCAELIVFMLATWRRDAWAMPVNARLSEGEIGRLAEHAQPRTIVFTSAVSTEASAHALQLSAKWEGNVHLLATGNDTPEKRHADGSEQVAALMYTTGTTGNPKGVMLTHANLAWYARTSSEFRRLTPDDRVYCVLPVTHIFGLASAFLGSLYAGTALQLASRFEAPGVFRAINEGATVLPAVPAMYAQMMEHAERIGLKWRGDTNLRYISSGGAPLDPDWKARVETFFGLPLHNGYGMTECSPGIATSQNLSLNSGETDISCGPPLPGLDVKLVPPPGQTELQDGVGEIIVRGPNIMKGYYRNEKETAAAIDKDGYFHTGDLGRFDEKEQLHVVGRCKELIIRSGFNVYPPEVEAALTSHQDVTLAAVVGRPEKDGNEEVLAFVRRAKGTRIGEKELQSFLEDDLAPYKRPSRIIVTDELPASSTGKILKNELIDHFEAELSAD